ncbi:MAG: ArnT family glycosyltransferase [bacterium]
MSTILKPTFPQISDRRWAVLIGLAVFAVFSYQIFLPWFPTYDSGVYLELARSLIHGGGYRYMGYIHNKYPPIFPLLLSPFFLISAHPIAAIRFFLVLVAAGSLSVTFLLFKEKETPYRGLLTALWFSLTPPLIYYSALVLSDVCYTAFSLSAFLMLKRWRNGHERKYLIGLALALCLSVLTRIIGFVLPAAILLSSFIDKSNNKIEPERLLRGIAVGALLVISLWQIRSVLVPPSAVMPPKLGDSHSYTNELLVKNRFQPDQPMIGLSVIIGRLKMNVPFYIRKVIPMSLGWYHLRRYHPGWILFPLLLLGFYRKPRNAEEIHLVLYMSILLNWPTPQGTRYLLPVIPFLIDYLIEGITCAAGFFRKLEFYKKKWFRVTALSVSVVIGGIYTYFLIIEAWNTHRWNTTGGFLAYENHFYFRQNILWAKKHLPKDTVLMSDRSSSTYHLSGLKTYPVRTADLHELLETIDKYRISYLITSRITGYGTPLNKAARDHPDLFQPVMENRWSGIYAVSRSGLSKITGEI